jgi:hypothetical protein
MVAFVVKATAKQSWQLPAERQGSLKGGALVFVSSGESVFVGGISAGGSVCCCCGGEVSEVCTEFSLVVKGGFVS